jgi:hypothetical protein
MAKTVGVYERPQKRGVPRAALVTLAVAVAATAASLAAYFF